MAADAKNASSPEEHAEEEMHRRELCARGELHWKGDRQTMLRAPLLSAVSSRSAPVQFFWSGPYSTAADGYSSGTNGAGEAEGSRSAAIFL
ncbi:MAG: hypothetical protein H6816_08150 [Phycisphaerales bacterium]|nr:hypothetical protein [Phycisphaerales bacterium]